MLRTLAVTLLLAACACSANTGNWYVPPKVVKPAVVTTAPASAVVTTAPASGEFVLTSAPISTPTPTLTPYTAFAWHAPAITQPLPHVVGTVWYVATSNPATVAAQLKAMPPGERAIHRYQGNAQLVNSADVPPLITAGAAAEAAFETGFFTALKAAGATVDYQVLDNEGIGQVSIPYTLNTPACQAATLAAIQATDTLIHAAECSTLQAVFPNAVVTGFGEGILSATTAPLAPDGNNVVQPAGPVMQGNAQAPAFYVGAANLAAQGLVDRAKPLTMVAWQVSNSRAYAQAGVRQIPWVSGRSSTASALGPNSPYYDELIWHLLLSAGTTNLNLFDSGDANGPDEAGDCAALDNDLSTIAGQAGNSPTLTPLTLSAVPYGSAVLVSAARCNNGRLLARVTIAATQPSDATVPVGVAGLPASVVVPAGQVGQWVTQ